MNDIARTPNKLPFWAGLFAVALFGGFMGAINVTWRRHGFPTWGVPADVTAVVVIAIAVFFLRRLKAKSTDEFSIAKKRYAATTGVMIGMIIFLLSGLWPILSPGSYAAFLVWCGSPDDVFVMGKVFGFFPFVLGLLIGQVAAWAKYR